MVKENRWVPLSIPTYVCLTSSSDGRQTTSGGLGSELQYENRLLLWRVPRYVVSIHRHCRALSPRTTYVLWRLSHSENLHRAEIQLGFFFCFCFSFCFSRWNSTYLLFFTKKRSLFLQLSAWYVLSFFLFLVWTRPSQFYYKMQSAPDPGHA